MIRSADAPARTRRHGVLVLLYLAALAWLWSGALRGSHSGAPDPPATAIPPPEAARMAASAAEPGGTLEEDLWEVLILFGVGDSQPAAWDARFGVSGGDLFAVEGYRFVAPDRIQPDGRWQLRTTAIAVETEPSLQYGSGEAVRKLVVPKGVLMRGAGTAATSVFVEGQTAAFRFSPMQLPVGGVARFLDGRVRVQRLVPATDLSGTRLRQHDFPALGAAGNGRLWATWISYHDRREELSLRVLDQGRWSRLIPVARASGDLWRPHVVADASNRPWLIWSEQQGGNWDLYAMSRDSDQTWGPLHRLTENPSPDIEPHACAGPDGTIYVVWQSFAGPASVIRLRYLRHGQWSAPVSVTGGPFDDWEPAVAAGPDGRAWIAWDRYTDNYDVYARSFSVSEGLGRELKVAGSKRFEAHVSVAVDRRNRPWIAWETGGVNWGKDVWGNVLSGDLGTTPPGSPLGDRRRIEIVCRDAGQWKTPAPLPGSDALALGSAGDSAPLLFMDPEGSVWISFKRRYSFKVFDRSVYWESYLARLDGGRWSEPMPLPHSWSRASSRMQLAAAHGRLWAFWTDEDRAFAFAGRPRDNRVLAGSLPLPPHAVEPELQAYRSAPDEAPPGHPHEAADVAAMRRYRVQLGGQDLRILRGDLHRHTELSQDFGGFGDGSLPELYRYMIDAADLDFGASTDHQGGGVDYWNYLTLECADMYRLPLRFVALYGYERNMPPPHGHRNIFHLTRDYPIVPFFQRISPKFMLPDTPDGEFVTQNSASYGGVNQDDTKLLYEELRRSGGLAIPHTTAGANQWRDNDPALDPVLEIYQGARDSSEHPGAPRSRNPANFGSAWDAWKRGYRIGVIASSDHYSTHISYAMVYVPEPSRTAIFDALRQRRTYAATDNIILEFWLGDHFMGEDCTAVAPGKIRVKVRGTGPIRAVRLIRDGQYIYAAAPGAPMADFEYLDVAATRGDHWYYVRVEQQDGQLAWSSPIWVRYR